MGYRVSGILKLPDGAPANNAEIEFISSKNFSPLVRELKSNIKCSATGAYDVTLEYGEYAVIVYPGGTYPAALGTIILAADTVAGLDLPTLLQQACWQPATPEYIQQIAAWLADANASAASAAQSEAIASSAATRAESAALITQHEAKPSAHQISGVAGLQTALDGKQPVNSLLSGIADGTTALSFRNKIINGYFSVNQRGYVSGAATTAGQYTLDRWKVTGAGGITFSTVNGKTTVTIPSGQTLVQIIESENLPAGDYVLSWGGSAQGRIASGAYGVSGNVKFTATGGSDVSIEFSAGTLSYVQIERGDVATPFEHRPHGTELALCQRYYQIMLIGGRAAGGFWYYVGNYIVTPRAVPTISITEYQVNEAPGHGYLVDSHGNQGVVYNAFNCGANNPAILATLAVNAEL